MAESCRGASGIQTKNFKVICSNVKTFCACIDESFFGTDLDSEYIQFYSAGNATQYYVWFNLTDGASVDPAPGGTGIQIDVLSTDVPGAISAAVVAAVDANADFCALQLDRQKNCFVIKTVDELTTNDPVSSDVAKLDPFVEAEGFYQDLGLTGSGGFSIATNTTTNEVTCDQTGSLVVSEDITGISPELEVIFKECNTALLKKIFAQGIGDTCVVGAEEYLGLGTSAIGRNVIERSNRITLHPTDKDQADRTGDITFMLAFPRIDTFDFPSEEAATITVTFRGYRDEFWKCEESNVLHFGDTRVA